MLAHLRTLDSSFRNHKLLMYRMVWSLAGPYGDLSILQELQTSWALAGVALHVRLHRIARLVKEWTLYCDKLSLLFLQLSSLLCRKHSRCVRDDYSIHAALTLSTKDIQNEFLKLEIHPFINVAAYHTSNVANGCMLSNFLAVKSWGVKYLLICLNKGFLLCWECG